MIIFKNNFVFVILYCLYLLYLIQRGASPIFNILIPNFSNYLYQNLFSFVTQIPLFLILFLKNKFILHNFGSFIQYAF